MRHSRWLLALAFSGVFFDIGQVQPVEAASTVQVKFVDHYDHGRIKLGTNDVTRRLSYGEVKGPFAVTPDDLHNDSTYVESLRIPGCGQSDIGYYYRPGHRYKIVVSSKPGYRCENSFGHDIHGPHAEVIKIS
jgi:hypothetical protein